MVISFENSDGLKRMIDAHKYPFVFLLDREREVYRQYGMIYKEKSKFRWRTMAAYLKLRLAGYPKLRAGLHKGQMGGDVVIDNRGIIRYISLSRYPEDRPEADELLKQLLQYGR